MSEFKQTPSQTVGPFFAYCLTAEQYAYPFDQVANENLISDESLPGQRIEIKGKVYDGNGDVIPDAMIELWQVDPDGRTDNPKFKGLGRVGTGFSKDNSFTFRTIKPGKVEGQAPHIIAVVFMRGLLTHTYTRIYFSDEAEANALDSTLNSVPAERRKTLIAEKQSGTNGYLFDIYMQGESETVFFDI